MQKNDGIRTLKKEQLKKRKRLTLTFTFIHSGLKYDYKAVNLLKGEQSHPG